MRAIWKGAVSFGLVSVPVKLYAATESHDVSFRQVHAKDGGRIKYQRVCSLDGEEVAYADIAKGYETEDGEMVILDDSDMADLPASSSREISVEKFVPSEQIDPMLFEKSYYLEPEKSGAKPYALLRQALVDADRMALVTVSLRRSIMERFPKESPRVNAAWAEAAAFPVPALTAEQVVSEALDVQPGETILVNGAGGVTGGMIVELAANHRARVIATASESSAARVMALGADVVVDYHDPEWTSLARDAAGSSGIRAAANAAGGGEADGWRRR